MHPYAAYGCIAYFRPPQPHTRSPLVNFLPSATLTTSPLVEQTVCRPQATPEKILTWSGQAKKVVTQKKLWGKKVVGQTSDFPSVH